MKQVPTLRFRAALAVAATALVLLYVPLTVLPILDGLLFAAPWIDVARDVGLLAWLALLPATALALVAWLASRLLARFGEERASRWAWALLLLPSLLLVIRQAGRMGWQWTRTVFDVQWQLAPATKLLVLALAAACLVALWRRFGPRLLPAGVQALQGAAGGTTLVLVLALCAIAWNPPHWVPMPSAPVSGGQVEGAKRAPHLIVITIDTVAAADARACDPATVTMPRLARFAQRAHCFERFYTASNFTTSSVSTQETGLLPWTHHANQPDSTMLAAVRGHTVAAQLRADGYRTHSVTDNFLASPRHRGSYADYDSSWVTRTALSGDRYRRWASRLPNTTLPRLLAISLAPLNWADSRLHRGSSSPYESEKVYADVTLLLKQEQPNGRPQFIWAQTLPPHSPYLPPASTRYRLLPPGELERWSDLLPDNIRYRQEQQPLVDKHRLRYQESLMAADAALGDFLDQLERDGWLEHSIVVIGTDHGESFERGFLGHAGPDVHEALVHGPLVIRLPGQQQGQKHSEPVSQADLAPTLLDLVGAPPLPHAEGRSLKPLLAGSALAPEPVFTMTLERQSRFRPIRQGRFAVIDGHEKLVLQMPEKQVHLFDLASAEGESLDLAAQRPERVMALRGLLEQQLQAAERRRQGLGP